MNNYIFINVIVTNHSKGKDRLSIEIFQSWSFYKNKKNKNAVIVSSCVQVTKDNEQLYIYQWDRHESFQKQVPTVNWDC